MANHKIALPAEFRALLDKQIQLNLEALDDGVLPEYPVFVNNLMKGLDTAGEELHHACTGMSGEAGELLDQSKKVWIYGKALDVAHLVEELGDLRFYYQAALNMLGITDEHIQAANVEKLRKRYTSGTYSDKDAIARKDKQPLSAEGAKGEEKPAPRKFMGQGDLVVTRDGVPCPDQKAALGEFKERCGITPTVDNEPDPMDPERQKVRDMLARVEAVNKAAAEQEK
jgi:NTP pyrophosphatase (non-canonical NTP hydrolase)